MMDLLPKGRGLCHGLNPENDISGHHIHTVGAGNKEYIQQLKYGLVRNIHYQVAVCMCSSFYGSFMVDACNEEMTGKYAS